MEHFPHQPQIGRVREVYGEWCDLVIYHRDGTKIGRESEPLGGPTSFEPSLDVADFVVIQKPKFPLPKYEWGLSLTLVEGEEA